MADAGFFRGTSSDQDGRFSDKEKKLLKVMRFEGLLETKINMRKVNLDVIKPWITVRINEILGNEDDVLIEYIINQLEAKDLNPKIMQINITGFLNARHARQFMGELWALLNEAQEAEDGVPPSLVEKKMVEMKKEGELNGTSKPAIKTLAQNDWAHRYQNLSLGRFSGTTKEKEVRDDRIVPRSLKSPDRRIGSVKRKKFDDRRGDRDRDREKGDRGDRDRERGERTERGERGDRERDRREKQTDKEREVESKRREEERLKRRAAEKERDRKRDEERDKRRHERRRRSRTRSRSPPRRRFTEDSGDRKKKRKESSDSESEIESKKEKKKEKRRDISSDDEKKEKDRKEKKKHKKEKKKKERKRSPSPSSDSDSD